MKPRPPTPLTDKFIHDLRERMASEKIKRTTLASLVGSSKQHVQRWFNGTRKPNGEFILKIQELLRKNFTNLW